MHTLQDSNNLLFFRGHGFFQFFIRTAEQILRHFWYYLKWLWDRKTKFNCVKQRALPLNHFFPLRWQPPLHILLRLILLWFKGLIDACQGANVHRTSPIFRPFNWSEIALWGVGIVRLVSWIVQFAQLTLMCFTFTSLVENFINILRIHQNLILKTLPFVKQLEFNCIL